jgi:hypothetical protein
MRLRSTACALLLVLWTSSLGAAPPPGDLSALAFLTGAWGGVEDGVAAEEVWIAPAGGSMLAIHRDVSGGRTVGFEYLRIEAGSDGVTYWASPEGKPATPFRLVESAPNRAVFENPDHVYPRRVLYWLGEDGSLRARIEGTLGGKPASQQWVWRRAP